MLLPTDERKQALQKTAIVLITQKLKRMDLDELREIYAASTKILEKKKIPFQEDSSF